MRRLALVVALVSLVVGFAVEAAATDRSTRIRFTIEDRAELEQLTRLVSIDDVRDNLVEAYASPGQLLALAKAGYTWEVLPHPAVGRILAMCPAGWEDNPSRVWNCYPAYSQYVGLLQNLAADYPNLCRLEDIGNGTNQSRPHDLLAMKISDNAGVDEDEPEVLYTSSMHGDEVTGYVLTLRLVDELLRNPSSDPLITELVQELEIWVNPLANPDGTFYSSDSNVSGATREYTTSSGGYSGVDPNRNFPDPVAGDHPDGNPWWTETVAMMAFADAHTFALGANFHGGAEVLNYLWDSTCREHGDDLWMQDISAAYAAQAHADAIPAGMSSYMDDCGFYSCDSDPCPYPGTVRGADWYEVYGGRQDYMSYFQGGREITIELDNYKMPDSSTLPAYWTANRQALLDYLAEALEGVRGTVTSAGGYPLLASVEVLGQDDPADNPTVFTDPAVGDYHRLLLPGTYDLRFSAYGFISQDHSGVVVSAGDATRLDVVMQPQSSVSVSGVVTTPEGRTPVAGATVTILGTPLDPAITGADGSYSFAAVLEDIYTFQVAADGYETLLQDRTVSTTSHVHDFVLAPLDIAWETDLETNEGGLIASGSPSPGWEWGTPSGPSPTPHSGTKLWGTRIASEYVNNAEWYLDLQGVTLPATAPSLSFWHWYAIESGWDGGNVSISTNGGASFTVLTPDGGYDGNVDALDDQPGYTGSSNGWELVRCDLASYAGQTVTIRWRFASDGSQTYAGWYLDDLVLAGVSYDADFEFEPVEPAVGQQVQFTDRSSGSVLAWSWAFGDGTTSTLQHPTHAYTSANTYQVTLQVTYASGTRTRRRFIDVGGGATPLFADGFESGDTSAWSATVH